jgi:GT2 family glycosyltransferase
MPPRLSIIVPTRDRSYEMPRTLGSLGRQTVAPDQYEVIVVADGCRDDTATVVRSLEVPYTLRLVEQPVLGPAAARNHGAAEARAALLLFLDDDMEASPGLVGAHLAAHEAHPGGVVLGYFPLPDAVGEADPFRQLVKRWWDEGFAARSRPGHRFTYRDFCGGHVSLPRVLFGDVGGFDTGFHMACREDYDLGMRLLKHGVRFHFMREAASIHHDRPSLTRILHCAQQEGASDVLLVRRHLELFRVLALARLAAAGSGRIPRPIWRLLWWQPALGSIGFWALRLLLSVAQAGKFHRSMWQTFLHMRGYSYWRGVRSEVGSLAEWERMVKEVTSEPPAVREVEIDVATDLPRIEELLEAAADAAVVRYREMTLGRIPPVPGAEPLRAAHVREELIQHFGGALLGLLMLDHLESPRATPCDGTSGGSRRDPCSPTSRGPGSANPSGRSSRPTGPSSKEDRLKSTPRTAEPVGIPPPEAVDLFLIKGELRQL